MCYLTIQIYFYIFQTENPGSWQIKAIIGVITARKNSSRLTLIDFGFVGRFRECESNRQD